MITSLPGSAQGAAGSDAGINDRFTAAVRLRKNLVLPMECLLPGFPLSVGIGEP
jgi:hypothetical protein